MELNEAVHRVFRQHWWIIVLAVAVCIYLDAVFVRTAKHRVLVWGLGMPAMVATGALLSAAADAYVVASVVLMLVQRTFVTGQIGRLARLWRDGRSGLTNVR